MLFFLKQVGWRLVIQLSVGAVSAIFFGVLFAVASATSASDATTTAWGLVGLIVCVVAYLLVFEWLEDAGRVSSIGDIYRRVRTGRWPS